MTDQEIEKLREKLGPEYSVKRQNGAITVELSDIWDGVEFAECIHWVGKFLENGRIFPLSVLNEDTLLHSIMESKIKPSTESAYVEQLKAKAHELYGEIKDWYLFDRSSLAYSSDPVSVGNQINIKYNSINDSLSFNGWVLYEKGKWAKKIERVEVEGSWIHFDDTYLSIRFSFPKKAVTEPSTVAAHLAKCLEQYLNKIP